MINKKINQYEILEKIGQGGMGVVYKAHDTKLDRMVALKFLPVGMSFNEERNKRFLNEAKAASALHHNNTCTIYEINETSDGQLYIVMPAYSGRSLDTLFNRGPLDLKQALDIAIQIGKGLMAAHEHNIIHRDIKSENIVITDEGQAVIMDFGLARRDESPTLTKAGETLGTVPYMSPEQAMGKEIDHRTDIWSLGVVLYEMLTGKRPFPGEYSQVVMYSILNEEPADVSGLRPEVPEKLEAIIEKALEKDRDDRYQSMAEMLDDLKGIQSGKVDFADSSGKSVAPRKSLFRLSSFSLTSVIIFLIISSTLIVFSLLYVAPNDNTGAISMAVLPFETLGEKENSTFTKGIHSGLLTRLANISGLKVTSRTSTLKYENDKTSIREIAEELNVNWIVRGEVQESPGRVQVDARLINTDEDRQVWASTYQRVLTANNLFEIQSNLALEITHELQARLTPSEKTRVEHKPTSNLSAFRHFIEGAELLEQRTPSAVLNSVDYFFKAVEEDSTYALAWAVLGEALIYIDFYKYDTLENYRISPADAIEKALTLNPDLAEAHASLGILHYTNKKGQQAVAELEKAIELQPSYETAQNWLGFLHLLLGQPEEAIDHARRATELNPLAPATRLYPSLTYLANNQIKQALKEVQRAREIQPEWGEVYAFEGLMLYHDKQYPEAMNALLKADSLIGREAKSVWLPDIAAMVELVQIATGKTDVNVLKQIRSTKQDPFWTGLVVAAQNRTDSALTVFQDIGQYSMWPNLSFRYYFPGILGPLRNDHRYQSIIENMNQQWK